MLINSNEILKNYQYIHNNLTSSSSEFMRQLSERSWFGFSYFFPIFRSFSLDVSIYDNILCKSWCNAHLLYIQRHVLHMKELSGTFEGNKRALTKIRSAFIITGRLLPRLSFLPQQTQAVFEFIFQNQ